MTADYGQNGATTGLGHINSEIRRLVDELIDTKNQLEGFTTRMVGEANDVEGLEDRLANPTPPNWPIGGQLGDTMEYTQSALSITRAIRGVVTRLESEV